MFSWKTGTGGVLALQKLEQENWCKIAQLRRNAFCLLHNHRLTGWRPSLHGHILYIQKWIKKLVMKNQCLCIVHHYIICLAVEMPQLMIKIYQNLSIFHYVGLSQRQYLWNSTWEPSAIHWLLHTWDIHRCKDRWHNSRIRTMFQPCWPYPRRCHKMIPTLNCNVIKFSNHTKLIV